MPTDLNYKTRAIAFLDVMGFKNIINKSQDMQFRSKLIESLIELKGMEHNRRNLAGMQFDYGKELTVFSDSIVISYDFSKEGAIFRILFDVIIMQIDLVAMGLLLRGGVTMGDVFHNGGVVVGPAMIKAYEMESKIAIYPRIIVDPILIDYAYENPSYLHTKDEEKEEVLSLLCPCENNYYYTDFLRMGNELGYEYNAFLNEVRRIIQNGLQFDIGIRNKYEWLHKYFQEVTGWE
ncbi:MAG: hypothetical protein ABFD18_03570 [Syntrophomonas sp.]